MIHYRLVVETPKANLSRAMQVIMQRKSRKHTSSKSDPGVNFASYPIGWLAGKVGLAEELVGLGISPLYLSN